MSYHATPPGWYDDPNDPTQQRFWDGTAWTEHRAPPPPPPYDLDERTHQLRLNAWYMVAIVLLASIVAGFFLLQTRLEERAHR